MTNYKNHLKIKLQLPNKRVWDFEIQNWNLIEIWILLFGTFIISWI